VAFFLVELLQKLIMHIGRLIAFLLGNKRNKTIVKQESSFLDLPLDLLFDVFDHLQLSERTLLSQTCRGLRYAFHHKCVLAFRVASVAERLECLAMLGDVLPDHRLCTPCGRLHLLDPKDLPVMDYDKFYRPCPALEHVMSRVMSRVYCMPYYAIAYRHVQLAMKYTRLECIHQNYRANILQKFTITIPRWYSTKLKFTAEPRIVRGRYILMTTNVFCAYEGPISYSLLSQVCFRLCPHLCASELVSSLQPDNQLLVTMRLAFNRAKVEPEMYSCDQCPTDYVIAVEDDRVTFNTWQDLGTGISEADSYWRSHVWDESENNRFRSAKFCYEHGSIRDMYYSNGI